MGMATLDQMRWRAIDEIDDLLDFEIAEDAVMRITVLFAEQAKEQEHVANPDAPVHQMRLRRAALAEQAGSILEEHRVVMAQVTRAQSSPARFGGVLAQPEIAIDRARGGTGWDRQTHRTPVDNGRWPAACRTVETLARKDNPHPVPVPERVESDNRSFRLYLRAHD